MISRSRDVSVDIGASGFDLVEGRFEALPSKQVGQENTARPFLAGFAIGVPGNLGIASWATFGRIFPFCWALDLGIGSVFAALIAGWLYRD